MSATNACPECGGRVPNDAPLGLCPRCLMNAASASATGDYHPAERPAGPEADRAAVDRPGLLRVVRELDLVTAEELDRVATAAGEDPTLLARGLVRAKLLTPYQAGAVLQGKARGLLVGPYLVLEQLGAGGMGLVFKARHRPSGRVVALKLLPPSFGRDPDAVRRFRREFQVASRLSHPNLVAAIEASEDRGVHYLTMEYVAGYDLDRLVSQGGPMDLRLALHCVVQAARGLEAAHAQGVIHRDVKPGNVMIDPAGAVRVLDLGLARVIEATARFGQSAGTLTRTGAYMGTVDFIAPEQADDAKAADGRADVYGLGCTLYFLLTGKPPFPGDTVLKRLMAHQQRPAPSIRAARPEAPEGLEEVYLRMMAKRPADRPQTMSELVLALEACRTTAREAGDVSVDLKAFARTVLKRAPARGRRGPDDSVFARPDPDAGGLTFDPGLNLEDLVGDYRPEAGRDPLPEEELPPIVSRPRPKRARRRRSPAPYGLIAVAVCGLAVAGYALRVGKAPVPDPVPARRPAPPPPTLSAAPASFPAPPGFQPLFAGDDLSGWEPKRSTLNDWVLAGGVLTATGSGTARTQLLSRRSHSEFVARFEFQIDQGTAGGLLLIGPDGGKYRFLEVGVGGPDPSRNTGRLWLGDGDVGSKSVDPNPPPGLSREQPWNAAEVEFRGGRLTVAMNGRPVSYFHDLSGLPGPRRLGFLAKDGTVRFRNVQTLDLSGGSAPPRPLRTFYADDFDLPWRGAAERGTQGNEGGVYYFNADGPGQWWWNCPGFGLPPFTLEATGRVVGAGAVDQGSWGFQVPLAKDRAFQVWINRKGEVWYEPNSWAPKDATGMVPRVGPFASPAVRAGDGFNTMTLHMRAGRVEAVVNGAPVFGPLDVRWDGPIEKVMKFIGCKSGRIRAEFDRVEIRELAD